MLAELRIRDFVIIGDLTLSFEPGLNIITGETGAGKSVIIEAINLLVGGRADVSRIRRGREAAEIEGLFIRGDGNEVVLRRRLGRDGKGRSFIDGQMATVGQLSEVADALLDIHGQHEHQTLLKPQTQLQLLDRFGGADLAQAHNTYTANLADYRSKARELAKLSTADTERAARKDFLSWQVKELAQADLTPGEDQDLELKISRLKSHARLFEDAEHARRLTDGEALDAAQAARVVIGRSLTADPTLQSVAEQLDAACAGLEEAAGLLRRYCEELAVDEGQLEAYQERYFLISDLKKKYNQTVSGLLELLEAGTNELALLEDSGTRAGRLTEELAEAKNNLIKAAGELRLLRFGAGQKFSQTVSEQLTELAMEKAVFSIEFIGLDQGPEEPVDGGLDHIEFRFSANCEGPARHLAKVASGGELARVMLAIRTVFGRADGTPTLIFDEIDAGIGGKTAVKVGERLFGLGLGRQVICVTHLAQIAAFADRHFCITKTEHDGQTAIELKVVSGDERLNELSRLGGVLNESTVSVDHARQLLRQAQERKAMAGQT